MPLRVSESVAEASHNVYGLRYSLWTNRSASGSVDRAENFGIPG
jgi:hypothetical protein